MVFAGLFSVPNFKEAFMILVRCGVVWLLQESGIVDRAAAQHDHCYLMENTSQRSHQRCMFTCTRHRGSWTCSYTNSSRARPSRATGRTMLTHTSYLRRKEQGRTSSTHARLDRAARPTRRGVGGGGNQPRCHCDGSQQSVNRR